MRAKNNDDALEGELLHLAGVDVEAIDPATLDSNNVLVGGFTRIDVTSQSHTLSPWESSWVDTAAAGGAVTETLPPDSDLSDGDRVRVSVEDGTNNTSVTTNSGQSIIGSPTTLTNAGESIMLEYKASNSTWMVMA